LGCGEKNFREIAANPAVREQTGAQFDPAANPKDPRLVYRGGGGQFFGRSLAVLGAVGDLPYIWEAGRVMSGKPPNPGRTQGSCCVTSSAVRPCHELEF
jgi:hypothetical protein